MLQVNYEAVARAAGREEIRRVRREEEESEKVMKTRNI